MNTTQQMSRRTRREMAKSLSGYRAASFARATGTLIILVDGEKQGLDTDNGRQRWYLICEDHGGICSHETRAIAEEWMSEPNGWCFGCQNIRDGYAWDIDHAIPAWEA